MNKRFFAAIVLVLLSIGAFAQQRADDIVGTWLTTSKNPARVEIYKQGDKYFGKIIWLKDPMQDGKDKTDIKNPDASLRSEKIMGLVILKNARFNGDDAWKDGSIYDPESGKTYSCNISLDGKNKLKLRGYVGISLLGRTEVWSRVN
jgi:uncharacterized protein (DUF2147 family)